MAVRDSLAAAPMLSRSEFCTITKLSVTSLENLARRNQLPFAVDQKKSGRGYTIFECFLCVFALSWSESFGMTRAAQIVANLADPLAARWTDIRSTAEELNRPNEGVLELLGFIAERSSRSGKFSTIAKCATWTELANDSELIEASRDGLYKITGALSASRSAALVQRRALQAGINLEEIFWHRAAEFRPRGKTARKRTR